MNRNRRLLLTFLVIGLVGSLAGYATFSAFSSTTVNSGNTFDTGSVVLTDNDAGSAMYNVTNQYPTSPQVQKCIKLTYTGSLAADVKLYTLSTIGAVTTYINLTIDRGTVSGTPAFPSCTGFTADSTIYSGTLGGFATAKNSYANGIAAYPGSQTQWNQNDTLYYRFTLSVQDNNSAQGLSAGSHDFTWEARNQ